MTQPTPRRQQPRILLIDDQLDVARTLSKLLNPLNGKFGFAEDGESGLQRLRTEVFDLALIDLSMPPNGSGGLWLLRQLAEHKIGVPTVVLSGHEGQEETIEAQRIGAADYVVKHKAEEELLEVVTEVLTEAAAEHWQVATTQLPAPVAIPLIESRLPADDVERLRHSIHCVESIFRFTSLMAVSPDRGLLVQYLEKPPSMGTWLSLCRELHNRTSGSILHEWLGVIVESASDPLVALRNSLNHGGMPTAAWAKDAQHDIDNWLAHFVTVAATRPLPRTVVAGKLEHTGHEFVADVASLKGNATTVAWERLYSSEPLQTGRAYLIADGPPVDLWPLILGEQADRLGQWNVFVLDSATRAGRLRYIPLGPNSGARTDSTITITNISTPQGQ